MAGVLFYCKRQKGGGVFYYCPHWMEVSLLLLSSLDGDGGGVCMLPQSVQRGRVPVWCPVYGASMYGPHLLSTKPVKILPSASFGMWSEKMASMVLQRLFCDPTELIFWIRYCSCIYLKLKISFYGYSFFHG